MLSTDGTWTAHFEHVLKALRTTAAALKRFTRVGYGLTAATLRSLTHSLLYSRLAYCLPIWSPTEDQCRQLTACITGPLRAFLQLPLTASALTVLTEFGLPSVTRYRQYHCLRLAARYITIRKDFPSHPLMHVLP
jgi:hypothetical protein